MSQVDEPPVALLPAASQFTTRQEQAEPNPHAATTSTTINTDTTATGTATAMAGAAAAVGGGRVRVGVQLRGAATGLVERLQPTRRLRRLAERLLRRPGSCAAAAGSAVALIGLCAVARAFAHSLLPRQVHRVVEGGAVAAHLLAHAHAHAPQCAALVAALPPLSGQALERLLRAYAALQVREGREAAALRLLLRKVSWWGGQVLQCRAILAAAALLHAHTARDLAYTGTLHLFFHSHRTLAQDEELHEYSAGRSLPLASIYMLHRARIRRKPLEERAAAWERVHEWGAAEARDIIETFGGFYRKIGQILVSACKAAEAVSSASRGAACT